MDQDVNCFDCTLCKVQSRSPFEHHTMWHPMIPYQKDFYKFDETRRMQFQCKICAEIINCRERREHHFRQHSMHASYWNSYKTVWMVEDVSTILWKKWSHNNSTMCYICRKMKNTFDLLHHFQCQYPYRLTRRKKIVNGYKQKDVEDVELMPLENIKTEKDDNSNNGSATDVQPAKPHVVFDEVSIGFIRKEKRQSDRVAAEVANEKRLLIKDENKEPMERHRHRECLNIMCCNENKFGCMERERYDKNKNHDEIVPVQHIKFEKNECNTDDEIVNDLSPNAIISRRKKIKTIFISLQIEKWSQMNELIGEKEKSNAITVDAVRAPIFSIKEENDEPMNNANRTSLSEVMVEKGFQCNICQATVNACNREVHRQKSHPKFVSFRDLFSILRVTYEPMINKKIWSPRKFATTVQCRHCRVKINRGHFMRHFEIFHPEKLNWSYARSTIKPDRNIGKGGRRDTDAKSISGKKVSEESQPFYTISVSHSELQRLVKQNRIFGHNGDFILKDSVKHTLQ